MSFKYKKKSGPSKFSLQYAQNKSQSQSLVRSENKHARHSMSQPTTSTESNDKKTISRSESMPTDSEMKSKDTDKKNPLSDSPVKITLVDLDATEDDFKPVKLKRAKPAPDLGKLKVKDTENENSGVDVTSSETLIEPSEQFDETEPITKKVKMEEIASRLKVFEKAAPEKLAVKGTKTSPEKSSENVFVVPAEVKPQSVVNSSSVPPKSSEAPKKDLPCPICNKHFKKNLRAHMKSCAGKNGLTTDQLLMALDLQKKQVDERRQLGLPQYLLSEKSTTRKKNGSSAVSDPNIQLALALSKSLKDAEEEEYLRETRMLLENQEGMTESQVDAAIKAVIQEPEPSTSARGLQTTLALGEAGQLRIKKFPPTVSFALPRNALSTNPPPYMTTTDEERLRRVTEKVAMCLLDEEIEEFVMKQPDLRLFEITDQLKEKLDEGSELWKLASISSDQERQTYYVQKLREFVSPSKSNSGVLHLAPVEPSYPKPKEHRLKRKALSPKVPSSPPKKKESSFTRDWASILNSRTMSDVIVYAKEERELRAHKLVFLVRCPAILKDLASEMSQDGSRVKEEMLLWSEYSEAVVMAALEFIYCDSTCRAMRLNDEELQDLEALAQRYELVELLSHLNMMEKLRAEVSQEDSQIEFRSPVPKMETIESIPAQDLQNDYASSNSKDSRPELAFLISQMDKSTLVPAHETAQMGTSKILCLDAESVGSTEVSVIENPKMKIREDLLVQDLETSDNEIIKESDEEVKAQDECIEDEQLQSDDDLFASLEDSRFCKDSTSDNLANASQKSAEKGSNGNNDEAIDDWRNLDGLDYLNTTPTRSSYSLTEAPLTPKTPQQALSTSNRSNFETSPFSSPGRFAKNESVPLEVVTLSSDSTSQKSVFSLSPKAPSPHTPEHHPLDDSLGVFEDGELTHIELAALQAYEKVMTPKPPSRAASTPGSSKVTPLLDYSIMESPLLKKELDKYGIKHLRRNQAKLILRHIYNELHPKFASTPLARPAKKTKGPVEQKRNLTKKAAPEATTSKATQPPVRRTTPKKSTPVKKPPPKPNPQPDPDYDSFDELLFDRPQPKPSLTQPVAQRSSKSSDSDSSNSSDNEGYGKYEGDDNLEDAFTQAPETQTDVSGQIEEILKSDPGLYHRILTYEPIWLEEIKDLLKANKVRVNPKFLLDYLDDQCITYRTDHQRPTKRATQKRGWTQSQRGRKKKDYDL